MPLTAGIVGLPNVGKSTLFNAITNSQAEAANYPFATIAPNVGVVEVPDARVRRLSELFSPKKTIYTTFEFTDIAGLVKGASKGEGLGNQFLAISAIPMRSAMSSAVLTTPISPMWKTRLTRYGMPKPSTWS